MHHFIATSTFSAKVYYVNQLRHSRGIPARSYCAAVSLLTVCLEPVVFVWAALQRGAHFHTFFTEVLQSFPISVFPIWPQVLLFLSALLSQCFPILQWIFKKKHSCSFPFFFPPQRRLNGNTTCGWIEGHLYLADFTLLYLSVVSYRNDTLLTEDSACLVRSLLLCLQHCDITGCSPLSTGGRRLVFTFSWRQWPPRDLRALAVSSLFSLISSCLAFALFLISLTLASFLLGGLFNSSHGGVFAVCSSSTASFLDVFSCSPR